MDRKEEIIFAALELASQNGLSGVSMAKIAEKLGIKKPSLYNHFKSKEEIILATYQYLRDKSKEKMSLAEIDYGELVKGKSTEEVLKQAVSNYETICGENEMLAFYKIIYSQRAVDPIAAKILADETRLMITATKNLFYALQVHKKLHADDIDMASISFAMTVHAIVDYQLDCLCAGEAIPKDILQNYIRWFCDQYGGENEENVD
ncbi:MAG: TetR/AcrR family transcriptional regulator [Oscillospiraceae bacterium]|nr:TetR/AcrR family transcriptional regulator [Oscillospiraceae bacterium]